ncbi:hypothetical protein GALMADRAFT_76876 [Galerina marginata CBS 339.88]|uniref:Protein kinase domain-containing protein n=1 Tax=Galerina marginata (strain CBS 339.88) TaxID=685588 RepID=A0A067SGR0_GALM3|nr:hypothetical protein GALMADRAFT_76876 [Galerina marginata CBS 339.88]
MLDGIRVKDNQRVVFKPVKTKSEEVPLATFLSSDSSRDDPRNCAVPILEVLPVPGDDDRALLVMPHLLPYFELPFRFLGKFCEFALQILQGLEYLHEQNIIHRDMCHGNIMVDSTKLVPKGHHFVRRDTHNGLDENFQWNTRWSVRPNQYYIIDFGISARCKTKNVLALGIWGQDMSVPELSREVPYDPFMVDVYQLGNVFMRCIKDYQGFDSFQELAESMTRKDPKERPTASEAVHLCKKIIAMVETSGKMKQRAWKLYKGKVWLSSIERAAVVCGWNPLR